MTINQTNYAAVSLCDLDARAGRLVAAEAKQGHQRKLERRLLRDGTVRKAMRRFTPTEATEFFWSRVAITQPDACWLWQGKLESRGYGQAHLLVNGSHRCVYAHRLAFLTVVGVIHANVLHKCDVPACCNPRHLYDGTQKQNILDRCRRGRGNNTHLKPDDIHAIRQLHANGVKLGDIASQFKTSVSNVSMIGTRKAWAWV